MTKPVNARPGGRAARVRAQVHRAVVELVREGMADLTLPAVADRAGVSPSTLYRRWGSVPALLDDVAAGRDRPAPRRCPTAAPSRPTCRSTRAPWPTRSLAHSAGCCCAPRCSPPPGLAATSPQTRRSACRRRCSPSAAHSSNTCSTARRRAARTRPPSTTYSTSSSHRCTCARALRPSSGPHASRRPGRPVARRPSPTDQRVARGL